jgi:hypothetical protein
MAELTDAADAFPRRPSRLLSKVETWRTRQSWETRSPADLLDYRASTASCRLPSQCGPRDSNAAVDRLRDQSMSLRLRTHSAPERHSGTCPHGQRAMSATRCARRYLIGGVTHASLAVEFATTPSWSKRRCRRALARRPRQPATDARNRCDLSLTHHHFDHSAGLREIARDHCGRPSKDEAFVGSWPCPHTIGRTS